LGSELVKNGYLPVTDAAGATEVVVEKCPQLKSLGICIRSLLFLGIRLVKIEGFEGLCEKKGQDFYFRDFLSR